MNYILYRARYGFVHGWYVVQNLVSTWFFRQNNLLSQPRRTVEFPMRILCALYYTVSGMVLRTKGIWQKNPHFHLIFLTKQPRSNGISYSPSTSLPQIVALQKKNGQIHLTQRAQRYHKGHKGITKGTKVSQRAQRYHKGHKVYHKGHKVYHKGRKIHLTQRTQSVSQGA
jgi:hypothetical protein